ncbi:sensor domain-containing diguanylate cyclase [Leptolyngbya sp. NK1-12]|uniref:Sensor domain-containing diguanylate cyclase n=1 Tax=Leptolyngbya sp. NK1-12 TaxID=2547451 RepID=A0AA96WF94_9CYAN|nr:sensor domain-containing diguanylate cyclase [Leptolyngbya sp. NK1-12]WNZ23964.1 sensor domain-containing diguanylate cyclase [Leptolyngbya sp. NK1-12]
MKPSWKHFYPQIKTAVLNLDSLDSLLQQAVEKIIALYQAECLLWSGLELGVADALRVFTTPATANRYAASLGFAYPPPPLPHWGGTEPHDTAVRQFRPRSLPHWLLDQQNLPQLLQLETGELIIPITNRGSLFESDAAGCTTANSLQFVVQLFRSTAPLPHSTDAPIETSSIAGSTASMTTATNCTVPIQGWSLTELESLEIICSQLGLAYSALYWRQRLEQSRQQAALVGRISHLLNSTLNPDEIVGRIVAELGLGLHCDRSILVDLRHDPVNTLAVWDHPGQELPPLDQRQIRQAYWQNVIEMFMQGGASYLQMGLNEPAADPLQIWLHDIGAQSVLVVPLFIQEQFFGGVALLAYQHQRTYLIDELQTIRQVADQAAIALTNAQHYQRLWRRQEALRMQNNSLQRAILRDELTQLMNRRSLERELEQLSMAAIWSMHPPFCIIVCDIDYFKHVNDAHGHLTGDEVLQEVAQRLQGQLRRGTPAYRYGGEEFVIILTDTPLDQAVEVSERLRRAMRSAPFVTKAGALEVSASFGIAQQDPSCDHSAWDVLQRADKALYEAKRQGRDRVYALETQG